MTTFNSEIDVDVTEYSLYISDTSTIDINGIRLIAEIASVNYLTAKRMLEEKEVCVLKAKALKIKEGIDRLRELNIDFFVKPFFKY